MRPLCRGSHSAALGGRWLLGGLQAVLELLCFRNPGLCLRCSPGHSLLEAWGPWLSPSPPGVECVQLGPACVSRFLAAPLTPQSLAKALKARPLVERHSREPKWDCVLSGKQLVLALDAGWGWGLGQ